MKPLVIPLDLSITEESSSTGFCSGKVCGDQVMTKDCGDGAALWLSQSLGRPGCRLLCQGDNCPRTSRKGKRNVCDKMYNYIYVPPPPQSQNMWRSVGVIFTFDVKTFDQVCKNDQQCKSVLYLVWL